jgi:hypothetical protein
MTKKERIWVVVSMIWLIAVFVVAINTSNSYNIRAELGLEKPVFDLRGFTSTFLLAGISPVVIGWGRWWIRRARAKES